MILAPDASRELNLFAGPVRESLRGRDKSPFVFLPHLAKVCGGTVCLVNFCCARFKHGGRLGRGRVGDAHVECDRQDPMTVAGYLERLVDQRKSAPPCVTPKMFSRSGRTRILTSELPDPISTTSIPNNRPYGSPLVRFISSSYSFPLIAYLPYLNWHRKAGEHLSTDKSQ